MSVYRLRARERPTVSTPVTWDEVEACTSRPDLVFTSDDVLARVERAGDLFAPLLGEPPVPGGARSSGSGCGRGCHRPVAVAAARSLGCRLRDGGPRRARLQGGPARPGRARSTRARCQEDDDVTGVPADRLTDEDLERELKHLHETRHDTFLHGSEDALQFHTARTTELEEDYLRRNPDRVIDARRTRHGSRELSGQDASPRLPEATPEDVAEQRAPRHATRGRAPTAVPLEAIAADVAEQTVDAGPAEHDAGRELPLEADAADAAEQAVVVELDEDERPDGAARRVAP